MQTVEGLLPRKMGKYLRTYRAAANLTQTDLGEKAGITLIRLSKIEQGKAVATEDEIEVLSRILHAPLETLRLTF